MRRLKCQVIGVLAVSFVVAFPIQAFGLPYGATGVPTWSNGNPIQSSGNAASIYAYPDATSGHTLEGKVNSIYMADPYSYNLVEAGIVTNGNSYGKDPGEAWVFAWYINPDGTLSPYDPYFIKEVTPGTWHQVTMRYRTQGEGATYPNTISIWIDNVLSKDFSNCNFPTGELWWGTERANLDTALSGSFASCQIISGSWTYVSYGDATYDCDPEQNFTDRLLYSQHKAMFEAQ